MLSNTELVNLIVNTKHERHMDAKTGTDINTDGLWQNIPLKDHDGRLVTTQTIRTDNPLTTRLQITDFVRRNIHELQRPQTTTALHVTPDDIERSMDLSAMRQMQPELQAKPAPTFTPKNTEKRTGPEILPW